MLTATSNISVPQTENDLISSVFVNGQAKLRKMVFETAKKCTGRELSGIYAKQNMQLDWDEFNTQFDAAYANTPTEVIAQRLIDNVYYLNSMADITALYFRYQEESNARQMAKGVQPSKQANNTILQFAKRA